MPQNPQKQQQHIPPQKTGTSSSQSPLVQDHCVSTSNQPECKYF
jgi:hypothetical protein